MDEATFISTLQKHLESYVSVPVRTAGQDDVDRLSTGVILEDWEHDNLSYNNSRYAGTDNIDVDNDGQDEFVRVYRYDWRERVDYLVKGVSDVKATQLLSNVREAIRWIERNPQDFHQHLNKANLLGSGNPIHEFSEPKETELNLSAEFDGIYLTTETADSIETIQNTFSVTD